jgi:hypothetical protein
MYRLVASAWCGAVRVRGCALGIGQIEGAVRDPVAHDELVPLVQRRHVEDEYIGVHEP